MSKPPRTPSEWLLFLADLADAHPLRTMTAAGSDLQRALHAFLVDAGKSGADPQDLRADLLTILPRLCTTIIQSEHAGAACGTCAGNFGFQLYSEIARHMKELSNQHETGGLH
ncbi:hypothetical protein HJC03_23695 [Rhizobium sp. NLR4b]|uniref:hypothetical protein n=1 Tax=Rhizobium sp. NLR4b TaxID=2731118 RepID=UPI001C82E254|nr:hypothetical protein [Rhizobium sp. NLR4b]MBX5253377.1 hypothetical protein [Rhizobium sp. NLR4b]